MTRAPLQDRGGWPARRWLQRAFCAVVAVLASSTLTAHAAEYPLAPGQSVVGQTQRYVIKQGDVLADIARRFDVGYTELAAANPGVDPWVPGVGRAITIPTLHVLPDAPHQGIVINLAQWRLFYFPPGGDRVVTYPLGLGVIGKKTPLGATTVVYKEPNPTWYPPASIRAERPELPAAIPPGPDNPLGAYSLHLGWPLYRIHGTNKPDGVGRNVSHGCIRLYPEDIEQLFNAVGIGTPVRTVDQPATVGWAGDGLYVQVYPSKHQTEEIDTEQPVSADPATGVDQLVNAAAGQYANAVDWGAVRRAAYVRNGTGVRVSDRSGSGAVAERNDTPQLAYPGDRLPQYSAAAQAPVYSYNQAPPSSYERPRPIEYYQVGPYRYDRAPEYPSYDATSRYPSYGEPQARSYGEAQQGRDGQRFEYPSYPGAYSRSSEW